LDAMLPPAGAIPERLHAAQRYSVLGGGKRLRPILVYCTGEALGVSLEALDAPAAAVELIHAYSLVHDDLRSMDDDDLRRGRPSVTRAFHEATAILAGHALQVLASDLLARDGLAQSYPARGDGVTARDCAAAASPAARVKMLEILASASGTA